jgi:hypothetical protein
MRTATCPPHSSPELEDDLALRAVLACARRSAEARHAERALLQATGDLASCSVAAWQRQRADGTTAEKLFVELQHMRVLLREARERAEILAARLERVEPRRRRHYTPRYGSGSSST